MVLVFMARGRGKGRGNRRESGIRDKSATFDNFSRNMQRPVMTAGGNDISLLHVVLIAIILYFVLRFLLPVIWIVFLILILVVLAKVVVGRL